MTDVEIEIAILKRDGKIDLDLVDNTFKLCAELYDRKIEAELEHNNGFYIKLKEEETECL